jgi:hypothetical protein
MGLDKKLSQLMDCPLPTKILKKNAIILTNMNNSLHQQNNIDY